MLATSGVLGACNWIVGNEAASSVLEREGDSSVSPADGAPTSSSSSGDTRPDAMGDAPPGVSACLELPGCTELPDIVPATRLAVTDKSVLWATAGSVVNESVLRIRRLDPADAGPEDGGTRDIGRALAVAALAANADTAYAFLGNDEASVKLHWSVDKTFEAVDAAEHGPPHGLAVLPRGIGWSGGQSNHLHVYTNAVTPSSLAVSMMAANEHRLAALLSPSSPASEIAIVTATNAGIQIEGRIHLACDGDSTGPTGLVLSATHLFMTGCCPERGICSSKVPLERFGSSTPTFQPVLAAADASNLFASDSALFWSSLDEGNDTIWRCSITEEGMCEGAQRVAHEPALAYARNKDAVYLLTSTRVLKIPHE